MLQVTIELWPFGQEEYKRVIGGLQIANDGTGTKEKGNYVYRESQNDEWKPSVTGFDRDTKEVERLVYEVLKKKYG